MNTISEIFAVGKWNGYEFTLSDLESIVFNFKKLREIAPEFKVPLKFGHNNEQSMTDGYPAIGWVEDIYVKNNKLIGVFGDVPSIVLKAMEKKLYRKVSVELDFDVEYKGQSYKYVLTAVALLGADLPAVSTLADLNAYIDGGLAASKQVNNTRLAGMLRGAFSAINGQDKLKEGINMSGDSVSLDDIKKIIADQTKPLVEQLTKAQDEVKKFAKEKAELEAMLEARSNSDKSVKAKLNRDAITSIMEEAVKSGSILPSQRESFSKMIGVDSDDKMLSVDIDEVKKMFNAGKNKMNYGTEEGVNSSSNRVFDDAGEELDRLAKEEIDKNTNLKYSRALEIVMARNKDITREYINGVN